MGNIRASSWLDYDASNEATSLGKQASRLAGAKKSGGGWGALLGGILGQILIPIPGVGAAIGAGLGGAAGSVASGAMSGVSQDDIRSGGKFYKGSRESILNTIAANQMDQSLMSAAKYGMMGLNPSSMLSKGTKGLTEGFSGGGGLMGGLKGGYQALAGKAPIAQVLGDTPTGGGWAPQGEGGISNAILQGDTNFDITDIIKTIDQSRVNTLNRTTETVGGIGAGTETFDVLDTSADMAQNLVQMPWDEEDAWAGIGGQ